MRPGTHLAWRWVVEDRLAGRKAWTALVSFESLSKAVRAARRMPGVTRVRRVEIRKAQHQ